MRYCRVVHERRHATGVVEQGAAWAFARYGFRAAAMRDLVAPAAGAAAANDAAASASSLPFKSLVGLIRRPCGGGTAAAAPAVAAPAASPPSAWQPPVRLPAPLL